ncbi:hypothetical protein JTB14_012716 [Gonioctena quinquepunctata]|nr:hypothetical protein JTB14_012716 [Gonioctena quinquepunctata]
MLKERLRREIEESGGQSPNQHGFRRGHSTTSAIEEVMKVARNRRNRLCSLVFQIGGTEIRSVKKLRYLGVVLDYWRTFGKHTKAAVKKVKMSAAALSRIIQNIGGPGKDLRKGEYPERHPLPMPKVGELELTLVIGEEVTCENMIAMMTEKEKNWAKVQGYITTIMGREKEDERAMQNR